VYIIDLRSRAFPNCCTELFLPCWFNHIPANCSGMASCPNRYPSERRSRAGRRVAFHLYTWAWQWKPARQTNRWVKRFPCLPARQALRLNSLTLVPFACSHRFRLASLDQPTCKFTEEPLKQSTDPSLASC
jgi:hypothetical protein